MATLQARLGQLRELKGVFELSCPLKEVRSMLFCSLLLLLA